MARFFPFVFLVVALVSGCNQPDDNDPYITTAYVLQIPQGLPPMDAFIPLNNPMTVEGVALGRKLFYDPILSGDNTQACADCHKQETGFGDPRRFSEGIDGSFGNRQAMTIINMGWNQFGFFWDGRETTLEDQALKPVTNPIEMNATWPEVEVKLNANADYKLLFKQAYDVDYIDSLTVAKAIAQFERTLISGNSRFDKWYNQQSSQLSESELRGFVLFQSNDGADCFHCHNLGGLITTNRFENNGLDLDFTADLGHFLVTGDLADKGRFRIPTLRNIELTAPYMHDGRFQTLEQVVDHYSEGLQWSENINASSLQFAHDGGVQLTPDEKQDLIAFLKTFTDQEFIANPSFSNPNP
ncbi:MAG: cytochrome-c peroxidase [Flavobacteriales bacterium]|jgi:cytochrome c peroxidase|nr:cytochrome-c peroxidase [Flavobacteriales bacterium]